MSLWSAPQFLKKCEQLKRLGTVLPFEVGAKLARGFADLGYEEFVLISEQTIVSLFSGKPTPLPADHAQFFFVVPNSDQMVQYLSVAGFDFEEVVYEEQRRWRVRIKQQSTGRNLEASGLQFTETLLDLLIQQGEH